MKRLIYGLLALFAALLLLRASSYGLVGHAIAHTSNRLLGSAGVALLVVILMAVAFHLIVPRPIRRWLLSFSEHVAGAAPRVARPEGVVRRRAPATRQQLVVVTGADLQGLGLHGLMMAMNGGTAQDTYATLRGAPPPGVEQAAMMRGRAPQPVTVPDEVIPPASPAARMRLTDVETALKSLGYRREEYKFVQSMDPTKPIEALVREALAKLRKS